MDSYIEGFQPALQKKLRQLRRAIASCAPRATEVISYGIPTFRLNGKNLVHFAGWKTHVGFYPASSGITNFQKELKNFERSRGTVRFPIDEPLPVDLVKRITRFRVGEILAGQKSNGQKAKEH